MVTQIVITRWHTLRSPVHQKPPPLFGLTWMAKAFFDPLTKRNAVSP